MTSDADGIRSRLLQLHEDVDERAARTARIHASRLQCRRGCHDCCVDGLSVFEVEADRIRRAHAVLLGHGAPHEEGVCAFLDDAGACRIYADRPYVCRTQGLPLRWIDTDDDGHTVEHRDICPLNDDGPAIESLSPETCWEIGPVEGRLAELQRADGNDLARVSLRDLFRRDFA